ncbi:hypothetical protein OS493_035315 [Desmophyllum pertusum]|uniref:Uncharacterized protein n=1 Tax=Desmophyllum pertusum TaxID=174260 RepID=A0A9W9YIU4_9CNID|nr:hypothetical protein OS493_035315 [Desmophyllum pertusum]
MNFSIWLGLFICLIACDGFVKSEAVDNGKLGMAARFKPDNLHLRMKRSELEKYFGVISHEEGRTDEILDLDLTIIAGASNNPFNKFNAELYQILGSKSEFGTSFLIIKMLSVF